jgi:hypothetical protein
MSGPSLRPARLNLGGVLVARVGARGARSGPGSPVSTLMVTKAM